MHRIDGDGHVANQFTEGVPGVQVATQITGDWLNALQEELAGVITGAGLTLNKADNGQLRKALNARLGSSVFLSAADLAVSNSSSTDGVVGIDAAAATPNEVRLTHPTSSASYFAGRFRAPEGAVIGSMWVRLRRITGTAVALPLDVLRYDYNPTGSVRTTAVIGSATVGGTAAQASVPAVSTSTSYAWAQVPLIASPGTITPGGYVVFAVPSTGPWVGINITDFRLDFSIP